MLIQNRQPLLRRNRCHGGVASPNNGKQRAVHPGQQGQLLAQNGEHRGDRNHQRAQAEEAGKQGWL